MVRNVVIAMLAILSPSVALAASTDVVFKGGMDITSTTGCTTGWDPNKHFFVATYWVPVAGSLNGPDSVISMREGLSSDGFQLRNGVFTSTFQSVQAMHVYTRIGTYNAFIKVTARSPATILTTTQNVTVVGAIQGFDFRPTCVLNFTMNVLRDLRP